MFRRNKPPVEEPATWGDIARAFRPIIIHQGGKLLILWAIQRAMLKGLEKELAEKGQRLP